MTQRFELDARLQVRFPGYGRCLVSVVSSLCSHTRNLLEHGDDLGPVEERLGIRPQKQVRTFDRPKLAKDRPLTKVRPISAWYPLHPLVLPVDSL
jgi:hypothetical protein